MPTLGTFIGGEMKFAISIGLLIGLFVGVLQIVSSQQVLEGQAKSAMILQFQGMEVNPEYARFAEIVVTTTDVQISMEQAKIHIFEGND
jgi:hypothetical protein